MKIKNPDRRSVIVFLITLILFSIIVHYWDELKSFMVSIFT